MNLENNNEYIQKFEIAKEANMRFKATLTLWANAEKKENC